jgi:hypothetical protein
MNIKRTRILILILSIFSLSLAGVYALISANLNIAGTATGTADFKIQFTNANVSNVDKASYTINTDGTILNITTNLTYPGDTVTINFTIGNTGNLAAVVNNLVINENSTTDFTIDIVGLDTIQGTTLDTNDITSGSVVVTWNSTSTTTTPEEVNFNVTIEYLQAT